MRKVYNVVLAVIGLALVGAIPAAAQEGPKIGFINSQRIIAEAPGARDVRETLEREMEGYREELNQLEEEIQKMIADYEQKRSMLTSEAREKQEEAIMQKQRDAQQRLMQLEDQAGRRQNELIEPIMRRIQDVIDSIRSEGNYAMIFDVSAGGVISADPNLDLTDQVLSRLRASAGNEQ